MEVVYRCCCGVDVHKKKTVACLYTGKSHEVREFGTTTGEIRGMANWLTEAGCEIVAMESTGAYWKPLYNLFEISGLETMVVNAAHMKALPGRKTDIKDAEWIGDLLRHGLLRASFIPDRTQRELREIARYRKSLTEERSREWNRLQKILEGANIKISSVIDINTASARNLMKVIIADKAIDRDELEDLVYGKVRSKVEALLPAIDGFTTPLQRRLLGCIIDHIDDMTRRITDLDVVINDYMAEYESAIDRISQLPGIARHSAEVVIAEIGKDMNRFPTAAHLASWAGVCPGNNQSGGKRLNGKSNKGNKTLKSTLIRSAHSAVKVKNSFFSAQFQRISVRRGKRRAILAVAHSMLIAIYHVLKHDVDFRDLGSDYYDTYNRERKIKGHLKRLEALGWSPEGSATVPA
jgi:transposase